MNLTSTISLPEVLWMLAVVPGSFYGVRLVRRSSFEFASLRRDKINGIRDYAALTTLLLYSAITLVMVGDSVIGLVAMTQPTPARKPTVTTWTLTSIFIFTTFVLAGTLYLVERRRNVLIVRLKEEDRAARKT